MNSGRRLRWSDLTKADRACLVALLLVLGTWMLLPAIAQDPAYHRFADQRQWLSVPHAADVLTNIGFALVGLAGLARLASSQRRRFSPATEAAMRCIAAGLTATAAGSAWYHLDPTDQSLVWDRLPLTLVFAGVVAAAIAQRVGDGAGRFALVALAVLGVAGIVHWTTTGNLSLYLTLQFGAIAALVLLLLLTKTGADPFPWTWVVALYVIAKIVEVADQRIWDATQGVVAGHALKHLFAAAASAATLWPLWTRAGHAAPTPPTS
jgi:hypothetical protein